MADPGTVGDLLTRATVWVAVIGYASAVCLLLDCRRVHDRSARLAWTVGCMFFAAHVCLAFHYFYGWSHRTGLEETALQTEELVGVRQGEGLYLNYVFAIVWAVDGLWWWSVGERRYRERNRLITTGLHTFMAFMIFNGAVVFGSGPVRIFGLVLTGVVLVRLVRFRSDLRRPESVARRFTSENE